MMDIVEDPLPATGAARCADGHHRPGWSVSDASRFKPLKLRHCEPTGRANARPMARNDENPTKKPALPPASLSFSIRLIG
jgi:hypothetical protein